MKPVWIRSVMLIMAIAMAVPSPASAAPSETALYVAHEGGRIVTVPHPPGTPTPFTYVGGAIFPAKSTRPKTLHLADTVLSSGIDIILCQPDCDGVVKGACTNVNGDYTLPSTFVANKRLVVFIQTISAGLYVGEEECEAVATAGTITLNYA